jgi:hypothetical protein
MNKIVFFLCLQLTSLLIILQCVTPIRHISLIGFRFVTSQHKLNIGDKLGQVPIYSEVGKQIPVNLFDYALTYSCSCDKEFILKHCNANPDANIVLITTPDVIIPEEFKMINKIKFLYIRKNDFSIFFNSAPEVFFLKEGIVQSRMKL